MKKPPLQLSVMICGFPYAGNGACSSEHPDVKDWLVETALKAKADPRVSAFYMKDLCDTPITHTRNRAIRIAKEHGADVLIMVDSDQSPNLHRNEPWFRPFWDEAFNFIYDNWHKGPRVVFAPYCGPPNGTENVYVFQWRNYGNRTLEETEFSLEPYSREQSVLMHGIQEAAAGPTGLIAIDMRVLDLIEPTGKSKRRILEEVQAGVIGVDEAMRSLREGYFYYEWKDCRADEKASTEDVTFTRDIALAGQIKYGYNPVFCAWDSWIGHHKPWNVGRPQRYTTEQVGETLKAAVLSDTSAYDGIVEVGNYTGGAAMRELNKAADRALADFEAQVIRNPGGTELREIVYQDGSRLKDLGTGTWRDHGHAPPEQQRVLADMIRSIYYRKGSPVRVLEVGSWIGRTAVVMADCMVEGHVVVHCVDTWEGTPTDMTGYLAVEAGGKDALFEAWKQTVGHRLDKTIFPWMGTSAHWAGAHWEPFDFMFIDADHTYEGCRQDIENWWPHLAEDGMMVGHDFATKDHEGVTKAVHDLFGEEFITAGWHPQGSLWVVRKKDHPNGPRKLFDEADKVLCEVC